MRTAHTFKLPNRLICDGSLSPSARKVGCVLYAHRTALGFCRKSFDALAALSGLCPATARKAVEELSQAGYLSFGRTWRYLQRKRRVVYGPTAYQLSLDFEGGYTLIPRDLLEQSAGLTHAAFLVCLCLLRCAGSSRRAFPSISALQRAAGLARSTVCRALQQLKSQAWLLVLLCRKRSGAFAANSYHFATVLTGPQAAAPCDPRRDNLARSRRGGAEQRRCPGDPQGVCKERKESMGWSSLHASIIKLRQTARKLFSRLGVVPFLANIVKT